MTNDCNTLNRTLQSANVRFKYSRIKAALEQRTESSAGDYSKLRYAYGGEILFLIFDQDYENENYTNTVLKCSSSDGDNFAAMCYLRSGLSIRKYTVTTFEKNFVRLSHITSFSDVHWAQT